MKYIFLFFILIFSFPAFSQFSSFDDIADVIDNKKLNDVVIIKGEIERIWEDRKFEVKDTTGKILIQINPQQQTKKLREGAMVSVSGEVKYSEDKSKYIRLSQVRELNYVKDPARCCMPEL